MTFKFEGLLSLFLLMKKKQIKKTKDTLRRSNLLKRKIGRPTVINKQVIQKLREAFLMGCTDEEACLFAGIGTSTLYKFIEKNPDFREQKNTWKEYPKLRSRKNVTDKIDEGNTSISQWYLERKAKDEFALRNEVTGKDGQDLVLNNPKATSTLMRTFASLLFGEEDKEDE